MFGFRLHDNREDGIFDRMTPAAYEAHMQRDLYGTFRLTNAIRPSPNLVPVEGYKEEDYCDEETGFTTPILIISASREKLFDVFHDLVAQLSDEVDVVLQSSHESESGAQVELSREEIDLPVVQSVACDFEDMLLHDGCTGIAIFDTANGEEVQLDDHKLLYVYSATLARFRSVLDSHNIPLRPKMTFIHDRAYSHMHQSSKAYADTFEQMAIALSIDDDGRDGSDGEDWKSGLVHS